MKIVLDLLCRTLIFVLGHQRVLLIIQKIAVDLLAQGGILVNLSLQHEFKNTES
jgi:hypothetical protein